jgi:hypothetical protein
MGGRPLLIFFAVLAATATSACAPAPSRRHVDRLDILITGNAYAFVEDCGCTTDVPTGGILRQAGAMRTILAGGEVAGPRGRQRPTGAVPAAAGPTARVLVELGNFSDAASDVTRIQSELAVASLRALPYASVGLGAAELSWPQQDLLALLGTGLPLTCCNLTFIRPRWAEAQDKSAELNAQLAPYRIAELEGGFRIGVIHVVQPNSETSMGELLGYELADPMPIVAQLVSQHKAEADYWLVTVANGQVEGSRNPTLEEVTGFDCIVGGPPPTESSNTMPVLMEPPKEHAKASVHMIQHFDKTGKRAAVEMNPIIVQGGPYDAELEQVWARLKPKLDQLAQDEAEEQMRLRATAKPPLYVGETVCISCHAPIAAQLKGSQHHHAYASLVERKVEHNAACVKCHVVGYGTPTGWNVVENQPQLQNVQCESCHGPGSLHVALKKKQAVDKALLTAAGRNSTGLLPANESTCVSCHTPDNSPHFNFTNYWAKIAH